MCPVPAQGRLCPCFAGTMSLMAPLPHSDVMFVVGQEQQKVFAHRCVLACRCQAFRGMLSQAPVGNQDSSSSVPPQGPFILGNVQPEVFLAVIEFLYTNSVTLNSHIVSGDMGLVGAVDMGGTMKGMQGKGVLCSSWCARVGGDGLCGALWLANRVMNVWGLNPAQRGVQSTLSQPWDLWLCIPWMVKMGTPQQET